MRLRPSSSPSSLSSSWWWLLAERRWAAEGEDAAAPPRWRRRRTRWMERSAERRMRQRESKESSSVWSTGKRREPEARGVGATRVEMLAGNVGRLPSPEEEGWVSVAGIGGGGELAVGKKGLLVKGYGSPVEGVAEEDGYLGVGGVATGGAGVGVGGGVGGDACAGGTATGVGVGWRGGGVRLGGGRGVSVVRGDAVWWWRWGGCGAAGGGGGNRGGDGRVAFVWVVEMVAAGSSSSKEKRRGRKAGGGGRSIARRDPAASTGGTGGDWREEGGVLVWGFGKKWFGGLAVSVWVQRAHGRERKTMPLHAQTQPRLLHCPVLDGWWRTGGGEWWSGAEAACQPVPCTVFWGFASVIAEERDGLR